MVDHLANGIELRLTENPGTTFKQALLLEFRKFGVHSFADVIEKRRKVMSIKYWKIIFGFFKSYFSFPKILATSSAIVVLALLFWNMPTGSKAEIINWIPPVLMSILLCFLLRNKYQDRMTVATNTKMWMLKD
ncbi:hypothetical protein [Maribacter sp.]|uniref:hypothetical protein n=1 Tax=Maribacter sp. TaxID=1897614 RepID=UPI0025B89E54|nr:hypothetical protein [Maribacter sp.]